MQTEKSDAIVLRVVDFSESSCVVTLFTRDFGKISGLAKGARRQKNPFEAAIDLLAICRIVFVHKTSEALDILTEAKLQRRFRSAATSLDRLYAAYYVIELLSNMTDEGDPYPELFDLAVDTLVAIDESPNPDDALIAFQLRTSGTLGHGPELDHCVACGKPVNAPGDETQKRIYFGLRDGGVLCGNCRQAKKSVVSVSRTGIDAIRIFCDPNRFGERIECSPGVRGEIRALVQSYIAHLLGFEPKLLKYVKKPGKFGSP